MEWHSLKLMEDRLDEMQHSNDLVERFNPDERMKEITEITETLYLIKQGKFK
jgi:hypothetical protein